MHENRETSQASRRLPAAGTDREGVSRKPERKACEESDRGKVSMKSPNKAEAPAWEAAEGLERRPRTAHGKSAHFLDSPHRKQLAANESGRGWCR
jgi:hypothetical protein